MREIITEKLKIELSKLYATTKNPKKIVASKPLAPSAILPAFIKPQIIRTVNKYATTYESLRLASTNIGKLMGINSGIMYKPIRTKNNIKVNLLTELKF